MNPLRTIVIGAALAAPFSILATPAMATTHTDPCPGKHVQVWAEVGHDGAGQATDHFVCGPIKGADGKDGKDGADSTVPGPQGPAGPAGADGTGSEGPAGAPGKDGESIVGPQGPAGADGHDGASIVGPEGPAGKDGHNGRDCGVDADQAVTGAASATGGGIGDAGDDAELAAGGDSGSGAALDCTGPAGPQGEPGVDGNPGATGAAGRDGVTKTVIVHEDGTTEVVAPLPHTGLSDQQKLFGAAGLALVVAGGVAFYTARKK